MAITDLVVSFRGLVSYVDGSSDSFESSGQWSTNLGGVVGTHNLALSQNSFQKLFGREAENVQSLFDLLPGTNSLNPISVISTEVSRFNLTLSLLISDSELPTSSLLLQWDNGVSQFVSGSESDYLSVLASPAGDFLRQVLDSVVTDTFLVAEPNLLVNQGTYVGNGTAQTIQVGFRPKVVMVLDELTTAAVWKSDAMGSSECAVMTSGDILTTAIDSFGTNSFSVGDFHRSNTDGRVYHWVAFGGDKTMTGSYIGNATDRAISTENTPIVVWVQVRDGQGVVFKTQDMPAAESFRLSNQADTGTRITGLTTSGFNIGTNVAVNDSNKIYHYFALADHSSLVTGTFVGDGTDDRDISIGLNPAFVVLRSSIQGGAVGARTKMTTVEGDKTLLFFSVVAQPNQIQALNTDGFQVGTDDNANKDMTTFYYWALSDNSTD